MFYICSHHISYAKAHKHTPGVKIYLLGYDIRFAMPFYFRIIFASFPLMKITRDKNTFSIAQHVFERYIPLNSRTQLDSNTIDSFVRCVCIILEEKSNLLNIVIYTQHINNRPNWVEENSRADVHLAFIVLRKRIIHNGWNQTSVEIFSHI